MISDLPHTKHAEYSVTTRWLARYRLGVVGIVQEEDNQDQLEAANASA
jgi:hypothetical protein